MVRGPDKVGYQGVIDPLFTGDADGPGPDLALVEVIGGFEVPPIGLAMVDRDSPAGDPVERCHAIGYPAFMVRETVGRGQFRETVDALGEVPVLSGLAGGLLSLQVTSCPEPLPPAQVALGDSPWSGMSGGPVVADGLLLGVVSEHAPRAGSSAITATPLTALETDPAHPLWGPGVADPGAWWARLGVRGTAELRRIPDGRRPEAAYWATLREIHRRTPQLLGRGHELARLSEFATGDDGYRWLAGGAWAGKTALVAEAVTSALPSTVDVVAYFLSRREADADSSHFLAAVVPQLAKLVDADQAAIGLHQFRALWEHACEQASAQDRHLLLVVDGLDEDLRPPGSPSVAAFLPAELGDRAHVLVTSRLHPELPADVPVKHPLRMAERVYLRASSYASDLPALAMQEIDDLLHRDNADLAVEVLGLLAAAAGPLAIGDLFGLIGGMGARPAASLRQIRRLVTEEAARSLQSVSSTDTPRYMFAHDSLLEYVQADIGLQHLECRLRIHQWARSWQEARWPAADAKTGAPRPAYLFDAYPATLSSEPKLLAALASDPEWVSAAIQETGVDSVLAHLLTARSAAPDDKAVSAMLATVLGRARYLRAPSVVDKRSHILRQLCLQAIELSDERLVMHFRTALMALDATGPAPLWTTRWARSLSAEFGNGNHKVRAVAVLPDGRVGCGGSNGQVFLWDPSKIRAALSELGWHNGMVNAVALLPEGRLLTAGEDGRLQVWDPAMKVANQKAFYGGHGAVTAVAVLPDGRIISAGSDGRALVRKLLDDQEHVSAEVSSHIGPVRAVAVMPDGRVLSVGDYALMLASDESPEKAVRMPLGRYLKSVQAIAAMEDGRVAVGTDEGHVLVWNPAWRRHRLIEVGRHDCPVRAVAVMLDGRVVSAGDDGQVLVWEPSHSRTAPVHLGDHDDCVRALAVLPDGRVVSAGDDGWVRLWNRPASGAVPMRRIRRGQRIRAVTVLPDGRVVSAGDDGQVLAWQPADARIAPVHLGDHDDCVRALAVLPDGRVVSAGDDRQVLIWDPTRPERRPLMLGQHHDSVRAAVVLGDGRVVSAGDDSRVWIWDISAPQAKPVHLGRHDSGVDAIALYPRGLIASTGSDGWVLIWDPAQPGLVPFVVGRYNEWMRVMAVISDGRVVTGAEDGRVLVWDPNRAQAEPLVLGQHDGAVRALAALPGKRVVSGGDDDQMVVWDLSRQCECTRVLCSPAAFAVAQHSTGNMCQLVVAHEDGSISGWLIHHP